MAPIIITDKKVWIFQADKDAFKISEALNDPEYSWDNWKVKQYTSNIKKGDLAVIWKSGANGGIFAYGEIKTNPFSTDKYNPVGDKYFIDSIKGKKLLEESLDRSIFKVTIRHILRFPSNPLHREVIKHFIPKLSILTQPRGTNKKVLSGEWRFLMILSLAHFMLNFDEADSKIVSGAFTEKVKEYKNSVTIESKLYDLNELRQFLYQQNCRKFFVDI